MDDKERQAALEKLRAPFEAHQINKLPKPYKKDAEKGNCKECGGYHGLPAAHLDYVGHAALTARLLEVDPTWSWEPLALDATGLPMLDKDGGMWIRLTVCGVSKLGYGSADGKTGGNAVKERIGDALRNAGMRFGAALELWHKGILYMDQDLYETPPEPPAKQILTQNWIEAVAACSTAEEVTAVWQVGVKEIQAAGDKPLYDQFKAAVGARGKALKKPMTDAEIEAADLARTGSQP